MRRKLERPALSLPNQPALVEVLRLGRSTSFSSIGPGRRAPTSVTILALRLLHTRHLLLRRRMNSKVRLSTDFRRHSHPTPLGNKVSLHLRGNAFLPTGAE